MGQSVIIAHLSDTTQEYSHGPLVELRKLIQYLVP